MFLWTDRQAVFLKVMLVVCAMALAHPVPVGRSNMLFFGRGHTMEDTQKQPLLLPRLR